MGTTRRTSWQVLVASRPRQLHHGSEVERPAISPTIPDSAGEGNVSDHVAAQAFTLDAGEGFQRTRHEPHLWSSFAARVDLPHNCSYQPTAHGGRRR